MKKILAFSVFVILFASCEKDDESIIDNQDNYDRSALLENWADNLIIPAYRNLVLELDTLQGLSNEFTSTPDEVSLANLRTAWFEAYLAWQAVDIFEIGKAEEITLRNYMNVYPLDAESMVESLLEGGYDLTLVNRQDEQGFAALDFMLYGLSDSDGEVVDFYTDVTNGEKYKAYMTELVERMYILSKSVLDDWENNYRDTFVGNDGSSATASVNSLINDYMFYYEKFLRAGKIGIPAGVFSGTALSSTVEARYSGLSKDLFLEALSASQDFFNGVHFDGAEDGLGISDYLDVLENSDSNEKLSALINDQFDVARVEAGNLMVDFGAQVETNNSLMTQIYDELQKNVVLMKVDMMQALDIRIDYVDADGD